MSDTVIYSIGQFRTKDVTNDVIGTSSDNYYSPLCGYEEGYVSNQIATDDGDTSSTYETDTTITALKACRFRDPVIQLSEQYEYENNSIVSNDTETFIKNDTYYIKMAIPRNQSYDCEYNIKLIKASSNNAVSGAPASKDYQLLKHISVSKGVSNSTLSHDVVLIRPYDDSFYLNHTDDEGQKDWVSDEDENSIDWNKVDNAYKGYLNSPIYNNNTVNAIYDYNSTGPLVIADIPMYGGSVVSNWTLDQTADNDNGKILVGTNKIYPTGGIFRNVNDKVTETRPSISATDYAGRIVYLTISATSSVSYLSENYSGVARKYYYSNGEVWIPIEDRYNDINLTTSWNTENSEQDLIYTELIFTPKDSGFDRIIVEKVRDIQDYNISYLIDGVLYYGTNCILQNIELRNITNLIGSTNLIDVTTYADDEKTIEGHMLSRIGVWGHNNALTSIEGEEFRIGNNGYYEIFIDNGNYFIDKFGLIVRNLYDKFLIDYEYPRLINYSEE